MLSSLCCLVYPTDPLLGPLPAALSWRAPCGFQFLGFSQAFMTSLLDVTGHAHDTGAFEEVDGILFYGEAGFLARLMDSPLQEEGSVLLTAC